LRFNCISELKPLKYLKKLVQLDLGYNQITELSPLKFLSHLSSLSLRSNKITMVYDLSYLKNLTQLNLRFNQIASVEPLKGLSGLIEVNLNDNLLTTLPDWLMNFELDLKLASLEEQICFESSSVAFSTTDIIEPNKICWAMRKMMH
jgi:Leucine-rich repeat (LRR) protein